MKDFWRGIYILQVGIPQQFSQELLLESQFNCNLVVDTMQLRGRLEVSHY